MQSRERVTLSLTGFTRDKQNGANGPVGVTLFEGDPISADGDGAEGGVTSPDEDSGCGRNDMGDVLTAFESDRA